MISNIIPYICLMVKKILILSLLFSYGCKTHIHYQYKTVDTIIINDTIELPSIHYHYTNNKNDMFCAWVETSKVEFIDTFDIKIIEPTYCKRKIHKKKYK